ncbi:MAG: hypothetical protein HKO94_12025, partial [Flavobacteriaceae bacterium]|nr:hypothetical protein [Flavobacteriaceae bacterium]
ARNISFFKNEVTRNAYVWGALMLSTSVMVFAYFSPLLQRVMSLVALNGEQFQIVILFGIGAIVLAQVMKRILRISV